MRICHIMYNYYPNITAPYEYTRKLVALGHDVSVVCLNDGTEKDRETIDGVNVIRIYLYPGRVFSHKYIVSYLKAVRGILGEEKYDISHVYAFRGCFVLPIICGKGIKKWCIDLRTGSVNRKKYLADISNIFTRIESLFFDARLAIKKELGFKVYGKNTHFDVLPLGADFNKFHPYLNTSFRTELDINDERKVVIFVSNLMKTRNPIRVIRAFEIAYKKNKNLFLLIVGGGEELDSLKAYTYDAAVDNVVLFTGGVLSEVVPDYMSIADVSLSYVPVVEQFDTQPPLKTVESLAMGLPTIATSTKGNKEFIEDGVNGLLVDDNEKEIANCICRLLDNEELRRKIMARARESVRKYDWICIVDNILIPFYKRILAA